MSRRWSLSSRTRLTLGSTKSRVRTFAALVSDFLHEVLNYPPIPDDMIGVPLEDDMSLVVFLDHCDVVVTYMPWPEGDTVFVDMIEAIPVGPFAPEGA